MLVVLKCLLAEVFEPQTTEYGQALTQTPISVSSMPPVFWLLPTLPQFQISSAAHNLSK